MSLSYPRWWAFTRRLAEAAEDGEWRFMVIVDLELARDEGALSLCLEELGSF